MTLTFDLYSSDGKEQVPEPLPKKRIEWMVFNHCGSMHFYYEDKSNFNNILHIFSKKSMCVHSVMYTYVHFYI